MRTTRYVVAALIGIVLIMGFDCTGGGESSNQVCNLSVKAKYSDSLRSKYKVQLEAALKLRDTAMMISADSAMRLLERVTPSGMLPPGAKAIQVNDSLRGTVISPDFTDAGVGLLISRGAKQGTSMANCITMALWLTINAGSIFEAPNPLAPIPWNCSQPDLCQWYMSLNQLYKWQGTDQTVKQAFIGMINQYAQWVNTPGYSGQLMVRNLAFNSTNNLPYANVMFSSYTPDPSNPNLRNFIITLSDVTMAR